VRTERSGSSTHAARGVQRHRRGARQRQRIVRQHCLSRCDCEEDGGRLGARPRPPTSALALPQHVRQTDRAGCLRKHNAILIACLQHSDVTSFDVVVQMPPYRPPRQMLTDQASNVLSKYTFGTLCYWVRSLDMRHEVQTP